MKPDETHSVPPLSELTAWAPQGCGLPELSRGTCTLPVPGLPAAASIGLPNPPHVRVTTFATGCDSAAGRLAPGAAAPAAPAPAAGAQARRPPPGGVWRRFDNVSVGQVDGGGGGERPRPSRRVLLVCR